MIKEIRISNLFDNDDDNDGVMIFKLNQPGQGTDNIRQIKLWDAIILQMAMIIGNMVRNQKQQLLQQTLPDVTI